MIAVDAEQEALVDGRSMPCPRDGCTSTAFVTLDDGFDTDAGEYLGECAAGHHGPRLVLNTRLLVE